MLREEGACCWSPGWRGRRSDLPDAFHQGTDSERMNHPPSQLHGERPMNLLQQIIDDLYDRKDVISIEKLGADTYQVKTRQGTFVLRRENQVVVAVCQQSKGVLQL